MLPVTGFIHAEQIFTTSTLFSVNLNRRRNYLINAVVFRIYRQKTAKCA